METWKINSFWEVYIPNMVPVNFYASNKTYRQLVVWHGNCSIFNIMGITRLWMDRFQNKVSGGGRQKKCDQKPPIHAEKVAGISSNTSVSLLYRHKKLVNQDVKFFSNTLLNLWKRKHHR